MKRKKQQLVLTNEQIGADNELGPFLTMFCYMADCFNEKQQLAMIRNKAAISDRLLNTHNVVSLEALAAYHHTIKPN